MTPVVLGALAAFIVACGGKTPLETCGLGGPVPFERPETGIPCEGSAGELFAIRDERDRDERCSQSLDVDLSRVTLIGWFLEDDCAYSGCVSLVGHLQPRSGGSSSGSGSARVMMRTGRSYQM